MFFIFRLLSFELFVELTILIFDLSDCLLFHSVLFLKLLLHFVCVTNVLTLCLLFGACDSVLSDCNFFLIVINACYFTRTASKGKVISKKTVSTPQIINYRAFRNQPVEEIAALAVYLASDESAFTTGTVNVIDGGWSV